MPTARISLTVNGNINPMRIVELVVQLCMAGHTVTLFVFAIIAAWFAVTMANACLNAPSVPVPYTQLRELPCEEDEPVIWFSSKRHVGRHISRSDTMSATLLRSAAGSQTLQNTSGNGVLANLTFAEDLWTGLSYEKRRGQLFLTVVEPSKCAVRRYFSRIQPLFSEKFLSEEHTTIPMNVEGTTDWTIFTPEQVLAGPCSCIATSGDKTHIAVVYSTTANESSIHTVRMFYPNNLKPFADDLLNEQEEQPDFILPIEEYTNTSAEFRLRGDLNVKSLEWTDENRCLTYSRSGDVVDYRRVCVVQDDKGGYFMVPKGVSKPAWGNLILTHVVNSTGSAYEVPNLVVAVRYSPGVIFVNVEWVKEGGEETVPEKNNTLSKYWETPLLPHWNASCNVVQLAVGGVRLHDRWLKAVSQRGGVMALPFIDDTLVVFDFDKIVSNQSKRCDENEKGVC